MASKEFDWDTFFEPIATDRPTVPWYNDAMCFDANPGFCKDHRECLFTVMASKLIAQRSDVQLQKDRAIAEHDEKFKLKFTMENYNNEKLKSSTTKKSSKSNSKKRPLFDLTLESDEEVETDHFDTGFIKEKYRKVEMENENSDEDRKLDSTDIDMKMVTHEVEMEPRNISDEEKQVQDTNIKNEDNTLVSDIEVGETFLPETIKRFGSVEEGCHSNLRTEYSTGVEEVRSVSIGNNTKVGDVKGAKDEFDILFNFVEKSTPEDEVKFVEHAAITHAKRFVTARANIDNNLKADQEKGASMWTLDQIKFYIPADTVTTVPPFYGNPEMLDEKSRKFIRHEIIEQSKILLPHDYHFSKSKMLMDKTWSKMERIPDMIKTLSEAEIRTFLDIIFHRICITNDLQMRMEHVIGQLNTKALPVAKSDYLFLRNGVCFGVAEAKAPFRLTSDSIPQFIIELLRIQARYENPDLSFFGILTDFRRFVFMELRGMTLTFEHEVGAFVRDRRVHVHEISSWDDLFRVTDLMNRMIRKHARVLDGCLTSKPSPMKKSPGASPKKSPAKFMKNKQSDEVICLE